MILDITLLLYTKEAAVSKSGVGILKTGSVWAPYRYGRWLWMLVDQVENERNAARIQGREVG
jgi:hypothetical protein